VKAKTSISRSFSFFQTVLPPCTRTTCRGTCDLLCTPPCILILDNVSGLTSMTPLLYTFVDDRPCEAHMWHTNPGLSYCTSHSKTLIRKGAVKRVCGTCSSKKAADPLAALTLCARPCGVREKEYEKERVTGQARCTMRGQL
jgi:hypothetical protein